MRVRLGPNITDARGTLGDVVYSIWRKGVHYIRSFPYSQSDPETDLQLLMRNCKAAAYTQWSGLAQAVKALWEEYAKQFVHRNQDLNQGGGTTNLIPHHRPPITGQNAFIQAYLRLCRHYVDTFTVPATGNQPCLVEDLAVAWDAVDNEIDITWTVPSVCGFSHTDYLLEPFEDEALNALPNAWTPAWAYNQPGTKHIECFNIVPCEGIKNSRLVLGTGTPVAHYNIADFATVDSIVVEQLWRLPAGGGSDQGMTVTGINGAVNKCQVINALGRLKYYDGAVLIDTGPLQINHCYHFKFVLHPARQQWDFYLDDMQTPYAVGIDYRFAGNAGSVVLAGITNIVYWDDIKVYRSNQILRVWLISYEAGAHKQIVCDVPIGNGVAHLTQARYAGGVLDLLDNNHGQYYLQCDVLGIDEAQNGLLSVPSQIFRVDVN